VHAAHPLPVCSNSLWFLCTDWKKGCQPFSEKEKNYPEMEREKSELAGK